MPNKTKNSDQDSTEDSKYKRGDMLLPPDLWEKAEKLRKKLYMTRAEFYRHALRQYMAAEEAKQS